MAFLTATALPLRPLSSPSQALTKFQPAPAKCPKRLRNVVKAAVDDIDSPDYNYYKAIKKEARRPATGFVMYAELMNGRAAMIGFVSALVIELVTGKGLVDILQTFLDK